MTELKQAYEILGLSTDVTKDEVEARYDQLFKKERAKIKRGEVSRDNAEFAEITAAYRAILKDDLDKYTAHYEEQEYSKYKGLADKVKKVDYFWHYYKWHTIGAIVVIGILIYVVFSVVQNQEQKRYEASLPPIDLHVSFLGEYLENQITDDMSLTEARLAQDFPALKRIESDIIFVPSDPSMQVAYLQKAFIMIGTESPDIYLLNDAMLEWGGNGEIFLPLDDLPEFASLMDTPYAKSHTHLETNKTSTLAIDLTGTSLAKDLNIAHITLYAAIRANAPNYDNAINFMKKYAAEITP